LNSQSILIVDDDESLRRIIEYNLKQRGYHTVAVDSAVKALEALRKSQFNLLISDMKLPGKDGIELMMEAKELRPDLPVIFITAFGTIEKAVQAMKAGAYDYITKPFERDDLLMTVAKVLEYHRLKDENVQLRSELDSRYGFSNIIGSSQAMQEIFATVKKVAPTDATVLVTGESGTGKELIARAIHLKSDRARSPMITVNCAAIPHELLESELFGYVAGAFTGAIKEKMGKFVVADGSTIFLDEIGDLHPDLQAKLLRVLQERVVEPVGSNESISIDIRVITATNQDLIEKVRKAEFREELFYRLNVIPIRIPPLRERPEDIPLLINHFLKQFSTDNEVTIEPDAREMMKGYRWPGNVRELENIIKRLVILNHGGRIKSHDLPQDMISDVEELTNIELDGVGKNYSTLMESEIKLITEALRYCGWNQSKAAMRLGIPRHVLIYRMKKYNIREE
jgi:DNA-binding NtrC family response regulator